MVGDGLSVVVVSGWLDCGLDSDVGAVEEEDSVFAVGSDGADSEVGAVESGLG